MRLLVVCTGNICRSAAADRLLHAWAAGSLDVRSAGVRARDGWPVHPHTAAALARLGVGTDGFASRRLSAADAEWADLILTMTTDHRDAVLAVYPRGLRKVFTLREAAALSTVLPEDVEPARLVTALAEARSLHRGLVGAYDVVDPIDGPPDLHAEVVGQISAALGTLLAVLGAGDAVRRPHLPPVPGAV
ncbi:MAG TPA: hypothetical protein VHF92_08100 [Geodermatophilus sp.]|nr:hypothetical protein [Geodermatophilus sp.]